MKKFLTLCLAAMMALTSAATVLADDDVMLISAEEDAVVEAVVVEEEKEIVDLLVIDSVNSPKTAPLYVSAFGRKVINIEIGNNNTNGQFPNGGRFVMPFAFPRQVTITVNAGENGTVSVPAKFFAACTSSRTFDITANEGYEIADILVNGVSYGPAYSVKLKNIQVAMDIEVVFAPIAPVVEEVEVVDAEVVEIEVTEEDAVVADDAAETEATEEDVAADDAAETEATEEDVAADDAAETEATEEDVAAETEATEEDVAAETEATEEDVAADDAAETEATDAE